MKLEAILCIGFSVLLAKLCNLKFSYLGTSDCVFLVSKIQFPDNLSFPDSRFQIFVLGLSPGPLAKEENKHRLNRVK